MTRIAKETMVDFDNLNYLSESAYDPTKWNLGKGLIANNGVTAVDKYIAPDFGIIRPMEESVPFATNQIFSYSISSTTSYIFGIENSTAASALRRIHLWEINRKNGVRSWKGFVSLTLSSATSHTVRDFKIDVISESTGTVAVSGTGVTWTGTLFATNKVAIWARIGFWSTDPSQITTWYRVSARASNTGITLSTPAGTITGGTPYVIQEFRPIYVATNATNTNGGIHYAKWVSIEDFTVWGTTIPLAVSTDDQKAVYWIKDALAQTNTIVAGCACDFANATPTQLDVYTLDMSSATIYKVYKYNLRTALTVASGASVSAFNLVTGNQPVIGTGSQNANLVIATTSHWLWNWVKSLYFVTSTRFYRANIADIITGSVGWISDSIAEIPPGGVTTHLATSALSTIEYLDSMDAFIIGTTHTGWQASYVTKYVASGQRFDKMFGRDFKYLEQSLKDSNCPSYFSNQSLPFAFSSAGTNRIFAVKQGTTISTNHIYVMAFGSDWDYAIVTWGRLISPEIMTPNAKKYYRVFANQIQYLGDTLLWKSVEQYRVYVRTANINTDATSGWSLLDSDNDISWFAWSASIQYAVEFRTIWETCIPARILGFNLSYEDDSMLPNYALSEEKSSSASKILAFYFRSAFGSTVPNLRINLYDINTAGLLLTDTTAASANGTWEKTTDGTTWTAYNSTDRANNTTYIRYTPNSIADNVRIEPRIVLA